MLPNCGESLHRLIEVPEGRWRIPLWLGGHDVSDGGGDVLDGQAEVVAPAVGVLHVSQRSEHRAGWPSEAADRIGADGVEDLGPIIGAFARARATTTTYTLDSGFWLGIAHALLG